MQGSQGKAALNDWQAIDLFYSVRVMKYELPYTDVCSASYWHVHSTRWTYACTSRQACVRDEMRSLYGDEGMNLHTESWASL